MKLCVKNGLIVNPKTKLMAVGDIWISNDKITSIDMEKECIGMIPPALTEDIKVIDATGKLVVPGFIDLHVHLREPGFEYKEDIESGCAAAARGGFTTICCMPNTNPVIDSQEVVEFIETRARKANGVQVLSVGAMSQGQEGLKSADYLGMLEAESTSKKLLGKGISAVSEDGKSLADAKMMLEGMKLAQEHQLPVFSHAEDPSMPGSPLGEVLMMARDIMLARETGASLHFCHVSIKKGVEMIREAKAEGLKVTGETAPHYFIMNHTMVQRDVNKKMNPPLRTEEDREAILQGLADGTLDVIATDHAPHSKEDKGGTFEEAANGIIGLETSFAVSYTKLVEGGAIPLMRLIELMSSKPAQILGLDRGDLSPGKAADIAIIDVEKSYTVQEDSFASKSSNSPFIGWELFGKVLYTLVNGEIVWEDLQGGEN